MTLTKNNNNKVRFKRFFPKESQQQQSRFSGFTKGHRQIFKNESISIHPYFQQWILQQCLEPLLQITGSINIWLSALLPTHALSICFRLLNKLRVTN